MGEFDITVRRCLPIWWAFFWRWLLFGILLGILIGVAIEICAIILGIIFHWNMTVVDPRARLLSLALGILATPFVASYAVVRAFRARYAGFRIVLLPRTAP